MPAPGDQHSSIANPFEEPKRQISTYTAQEIATLQSRLEKQLGPEYISARQGPSGQKVHYITAEKCIALANEVFGFNGWSSSIQNIQVDFCDEHPQTLKISLGLSVIVRVTLRDGTFHEDIGYGHIENCKGKAAAFEKAKKEGTTDALKRALRNFGNVLGNCIYDKAYLAKVTKLKVAPTKFDVDALHRHADFVKKEPVEAEPQLPAIAPAPAKPETTATLPQALIPSDSFDDFLGELDEADFNMAEGGNPDEVVLPASNDTSSNERPQQQTANNTSMQPPNRPLSRSTSAGSAPSRPPQTPNQHHHAPKPITNSFAGAQNNGSNPGPRPQPQFNQQKHPIPQQNNRPSVQPPAAPQPGASPGAAQPDGVPEAVGFFSARAVTQFSEETIEKGRILPKAGQTFNPQAESPSIRKTPGIDHSKSKPVGKGGIHVPPIVGSEAVQGVAVPGASVPAARGNTRPGPPMARGNNVMNPQLDQTRRIGAPGSSSPLANRGNYRPLTMKRPAAGDGRDSPGPGRAPLADVSNQGSTGGAGGPPGPDVKRQKIG
ncbi:hypothetical protein QBC47DRAFT_367560 [Echria macrotheca]|uniref:RAD52 homolog n=1 Tax=Echria macrotheca TaxID=438768 RepID=A0AAJ0FG37_9PEZI|nr:hypothetical protein QBC47DRAFT_367560 [Echria macrotheca]